MREELIISGRLNKGIDPILHVWGWEIAVYLFLGGLAAGLLIYAASVLLIKKNDSFKTATQLAPLFVPVFLSMGLFALFLDLHHKLFFWQLYTTIRIQSPMSWGAWTLLLITPVSIVYAVLQLKKLFPHVNFMCKQGKCLDKILTHQEGLVNWDWKFNWMREVESFCKKNISWIIWAMLILGVILGMYTGILLSAFNARPLWNTSILGLLFLTSGLSAAAAFIILLSNDEKEKHFFTKIDLIMIGVELFLIVHLFMGFLASTQVQIEAAYLFLGGPYTVVFWVFVVTIGLIIPAIIEIMELRGKHIPLAFSAPILILIGGLILRFVMVYAGQASRYLY